MKVSLEWLKDFADVAASPEEVSDQLTMAGLEVEGMERVDGDTVFEVNVTPNRPDCLSILGIAREVAAAFDIPLKLPSHELKGDFPPSDMKVEIADPDLCHRYAGRMITGVTVGDSPDWLRNRLERCGVRSLNNNVVDITNYVLLEFGHPLHAFDASVLSGSVIRVAKAGCGRSMITLDGIERELPEDGLLIWDGRRPVAIAGIMGGEESSVHLDTRDIFLESAYFLPTSVRRASKTLGLRTESSYRFERGTDIEFLVYALDRAAMLMREAGGGTIHAMVDAYPVKHTPSLVAVRYERMSGLIGAEIPREAMRGLLWRIGIKTEDRGDHFVAYPPAFRRDITDPIDVVEEIARRYGFGNIPVSLPKTELSDGRLDERERNIQGIRESLLKSGFSEVINYSFMNPADLDLLQLHDDDPRRRTIRVRNPLRQEDGLMRTTLIPALVRNFSHNHARGIQGIRLFELARVFLDQGEQLPDEELRVGGIFFSGSVPGLWREETTPFFSVKGALQALFEEFRITGCSFVPSEEPFLHQGKSADIVAASQVIGFLGELDPHVADRLDLKVQKPEIVIFELDVEMLFALIPRRIVYSPIPRYPSVERDIAVVVRDDMPSEVVLRSLKSLRSEFIERIELFDHFKGKNLPPDRKSLGVRIVYRSRTRTLTDGEVEEFHGELVKVLLERTGGELRGT